MKKINLFLNNFGNKNDCSFYLSVFRVVISLILIKEVFQVQPILSLMYQNGSFLKSPETIVEFIRFDASYLEKNIYLFIYVYVFFLSLYIFGIGKNFTAFIVFVLTDMLQKLCPQILNGGDNLLKFILLYMIFADSYNYFSLKKIDKEGDKKYYLNFLSNLSVLAICIHLCVIYFISAIHKLNANVWFHGIATYYTFQLERFSGTPFNKTLSHSTVFVVFSTYFALLTEMFYPVLVWFKGTKKIVIVCMILVHSGIYIFMMIYDFQLIFILAQGFFFKDIFWAPLINKIVNKKSKNVQLSKP